MLFMLTYRRRATAWLPALVLVTMLVLLLWPELRMDSGPSMSAVHPQKLSLAAEHLRSDQLYEFWEQLRRDLVLNDPRVPELSTTAPVETAELGGDATNATPRPDLIDMPRSDVAAMQTRHDAFAASARRLAPRLPRWKGTRGIVMTAGGGYLGTAVTSVLMLRRSGSALPVQLFLDTHRERNETALCDTVLRAHDVECLVLEDLLRDARAADMRHFQFKVLAMLFSTFEQILFLDSDAWPVHAPDRLFDAAPFTTHGLVTWPDFWLGTASPRYYEVARLPRPPLLARRSSESGILLYNKATHAESLLLAVYYNWYGPGRYYPLLSQGAHGEGDKETFLHAALALHQPFWDVRTPIDIAGRHINGSFESAAMKQADPAEDYALHTQRPGQELEEHGAREPYLKKARKGARTMFVHHNQIKMDISTVGAEDHMMFHRDGAGDGGKPAYKRLWGEEPDLREQSGYDVERALWDVVLETNCRATLLAECARIQKWYQEVFIDAEEAAAVHRTAEAAKAEKGNARRRRKRS